MVVPAPADRPKDAAPRARIDLPRLEAALAALVGQPRVVAQASVRARARARGAVYTPAPLVALVVEQVLGPMRGWAPPALRVLDPACGDGRFLVAAARWAREHLPKTRVTLCGFERDPEVAATARRALAGLAAEIQIAASEALLEARLDAPVDAVVGNPPYVRSIRLRAHDPKLWRALRGRFAATSHGEWDLYAAFLERSLTWARPRGRVGLIVPSRWLTAAFAAPLRGAIADSVEAVIDFGAAQLFPDATTYTSVALLEPGRAPGPATFVRYSDSGWRQEARELGRAGAAPWWPARRPGLALGEVAQIVKGCGTNADKIYVVRAQRRGELLVGTNGQGDDVCVEASAARPCLRGREVRDDALEAGAPQSFCVLPYGGVGPGQRPSLLGWDELSRAAPRTAAYLAAHRAALAGRERGRFDDDAFYRFGRPQNLTFLLDLAPKVVIPDVTNAGRAVIDRGSLVLDSAYALRPRPGAPAPWDDVALLAALLRSAAVRRWLDGVGVRLRGGYVRMKTAFLAPMPLPPEGPALARASAAAAAGRLAEASAAIEEAYAAALPSHCPPTG